MIVLHILALGLGPAVFGLLLVIHSRQHPRPGTRDATGHVRTLEGTVQPLVSDDGDGRCRRPDRGSC